MSAGVVNVVFYATLGRGDMLTDGLVDMLGPASIRHGATKYSVLRSNDDRFNIKTFFWFNSHEDWYRFWEGEEAVEFRRRYSGKFQVPLTYVWHDEVGSEADVPALHRVTADQEVVS